MDMCRHSCGLLGCTAKPGHPGLHHSLYYPDRCWDDYRATFPQQVSAYCGAHGLPSVIGGPVPMCVLVWNHTGTEYHLDSRKYAWAVVPQQALCDSVKNAYGALHACALNYGHQGPHESLDGDRWAASEWPRGTWVAIEPPSELVPARTRAQRRKRRH